MDISPHSLRYYPYEQQQSVLRLLQCEVHGSQRCSFLGYTAGQGDSKGGYPDFIAARGCGQEARREKRGFVVLAGLPWDDAAGNLWWPALLSIASAPIDFFSQVLLLCRCLIDQFGKKCHVPSTFFRERIYLSTLARQNNCQVRHVR